MKRRGSRSSEKESNIYTLTIKERAIKALKKIPNNIALKLDEKIRALAYNPRPDGCKKLEGYETVYRIRHSDYRVVYTIEDKKLVVEIIHIGNRKEVYKGLK